MIWIVDRDEMMAWDKDLEIDYFFFLTRVKKPVRPHVLDNKVSEVRLWLGQAGAAGSRAARIMQA